MYEGFLTLRSLPLSVGFRKSRRQLLFDALADVDNPDKLAGVSPHGLHVLASASANHGSAAQRANAQPFRCRSLTSDFDCHGRPHISFASSVASHRPHPLIRGSRGSGEAKNRQSYIQAVTSSRRQRLLDRDQTQTTPVTLIAKPTSGVKEARTSSSSVVCFEDERVGVQTRSSQGQKRPSGQSFEVDLEKIRRRAKT